MYISIFKKVTVELFNGAFGAKSICKRVQKISFIELNALGAFSSIKKLQFNYNLGFMTICCHLIEIQARFLIIVYNLQEYQQMFNTSINSKLEESFLIMI